MFLIRFLNIDSVAQEYVPERQPAVTFHDEAEARSAIQENFAFHELSVPRRPAWTPGVTTAEELEAMENESFYEWRRGLARKEEEIAALAFKAHGGGVGGASVTPYEKNLHVWRQLWRVLERSSVVLQIVDARNPLFYLSDDLRTYAMEELGKPMLMIINKGDYLTDVQRKAWSEYFAGKGVDHLFFSAYEEQKRIDEAAVAAKREELFEDEQSRASDEIDVENGSVAIEETLDSHVQPFSEDATKQRADLLTREELLDALTAFAEKHGCSPEEKYDNRIQYGMVGFPNGKSNKLMYQWTIF
jgi:large subunit GTPase 1